VKSAAHSRIFPAYPHYTAVFQFLLECPSLVFMSLAYIKTLKNTVMKTFEKNYIAKGKQIKGMQIVRISIKVEDILQHAHEYKGEQYLTFEVAKLQNPDSFGNDYTVYVNKLVETEEKSQKTAPKTAPPAEKSPKNTKKPAKATKKPSNNEIPF